MPLLGPNGLPLSEQPPADAEPVPVPEQPTGPLPCVTAFIVYMTPDGQWQVADDLNTPLVPGRKPHGDDFTSASATIARDVANQELINAFAQSLGPSIVQSTAQTVVNAQMQMAQQARQQFESQALAEKIEREKIQAGRR